MTIPQDVLYGSEQFRDWLLDLKERALLVDTIQAYAMLRAVLLEVRDRSTTDAALRLADALPPLVRGIMLEGWHPEAPGGLVLAFTDAVKARLATHGTEPDRGLVDDVLRVLARRIFPQCRSAWTEHLPAELQGPWQTAIRESADERR